MPTELRSERRGDTLVLSFHGSAAAEFSAELLSACVEALNVAASMPDIRAVVLAGEGSAFLSSPPSAAAAPALSQLVDAIRTSPQPVVAVVEGGVSGAAASLVWSSDLVVAGRNATAVLNQDPGLEPLARGLPRHLTQQLIWFNEPIHADALHRFGLVNWVTEPGRATDRALQAIEQLGSQPPAALAFSKERLTEARGPKGHSTRVDP